MNREEKFLRVLYKTEDVRKIMINDVYQELKAYVMPKQCISADNLVAKNRRDNLVKAKKGIVDFLESNCDYKKIVYDAYGKEIKYFLYGYVFYLAKTSEEYRELEIFEDKRSILYRGISLIDGL